MKKIIKIKESQLVNLIENLISGTTKKENIITEIGEGNISFNTKLEKDNDTYYFEIKDENFKFNDFYIYIKLHDSSFVKFGERNNYGIKGNLSYAYNMVMNENKINTMEVSFGFFDADGWSFPILNTGNLFKIMGSVLNSIKYVLSENKDIEYIIYKPVSKSYKPTYTLKIAEKEKGLPIKKGPFYLSDIIKMLEKKEITPNTEIKRKDLDKFVKISDLEEIKSYNKTEGDLVSDKGGQRKNLYAAYIKKNFPNSNIKQIKNAVIVKLN